MIKDLAVKTGILFLILFVISGCASVMPPDLQKAEVATYRVPKLPGNAKAIVYVIFEESWHNDVRFTVYLDSQEPASAIGYNMGGQYIYFELSPGKHTILSKAENWAKIDVSARAGDVLFMRQELYPGVLDARNKLSMLEEYEGKYYVKNLARGSIFNKDQQIAPTVPAQAGPEPSARSATFTGTITGGNFAKGVGFSNINVLLEVTSDNGGKDSFYVRSDSILVDAKGKQVDYLYAIQSKGRKVDIEHYIIKDATGGDPSRSDFAFEIGKKGVLLMRFLDWKSTE